MVGGQTKKAPSLIPYHRREILLGSRTYCESWKIYKIIGKYVHDLGIYTMKKKTDEFNHMKM